MHKVVWAGVICITEDIHRRCKRLQSPRDWLCEVDDPSVSAGGVDYRVNVRPDSSCWDALGSGSGLPHRIRGCVHLRED